ncbi:uncharacterized protein [Blastocystis hominis]|uniref:Uncharacterized protein n=1 Tax=Blastocystis hominis TaxID=12968 RepID=D8M2C1_BLAHO|nr:uncharacterized protein [Blastocystis hominis]CBK22216.2 unnamed protein product [Blastocystis hominis]|eukprot:XP_012896264.1 uncharacterized protein [Blastocystis hominis]
MDIFEKRIDKGVSTRFLFAETDETPEQATGKMAGETPSETLDETPVEPNGETPHKTPSETPHKTPNETPSETPSETPDKTPRGKAGENALYRGFMEYMLAIAPGNAHAVDLALHYLEGTRGFEADPARAKEMLRESTAGLARFYLGVMSQSEELGGEDVEAAKMNFDAACRDNRGDVN